MIIPICNHMIGPMSKWEVIFMEFVVGFPLTSHRNDSIIVVVDKLTKTAHFIPIKETYDLVDVTQVFISEIVHIHGFPRILS